MPRRTVGGGGKDDANVSAAWWLEDAGEDCACDPEGGELHHWDVTYNLNPMLWEAGWRWPSGKSRSTLAVVTTARFGDRTAPLDSTEMTVWSSDIMQGLRAGDIGEKVLAVITNLKADPDRYRSMNPPNGWGDYDGLVREFESFLQAIEAHPNARIGCWF